MEKTFSELNKLKSPLIWVFKHFVEGFLLIIFLNKMCICTIPHHNCLQIQTQKNSIERFPLFQIHLSFQFLYLCFFTFIFPFIFFFFFFFVILCTPSSVVHLSKGIIKETQSCYVKNDLQQLVFFW